jgi:hypothetical protein
MDEQYLNVNEGVEIRPVEVSLETLRIRYGTIQNNGLSEIDTQVLLIEPVFQLAGWNIYNHQEIRRANRNGRVKGAPQFDVEIYGADQQLKFAVECKALNSGEFNIDKLASKKGIGKLIRELKDRTFRERQGDGVGQLRWYCWRYFRSKKILPIPVLTNGLEWVLFEKDLFCVEGNLRQHITETDIFDHAKLTDADFDQRVINRLKKSNGCQP